MTVGLILTLWLGIGAQIYNPPIGGYVPPQMSVSQCPITCNGTECDITTSIYMASTSRSPESQLVWYLHFVLVIKTDILIIRYDINLDFS